MHTSVSARKAAEGEMPGVQIHVIYDDPDLAMIDLRNAFSEAQRRLLQAQRPQRDTRTY